MDGLIVLRNLTFNGRHGDFILDTGCTYALVVEQSVFPGQMRPSAKAGLSAAGTITQYDLPVTQFDLGLVRPPKPRKLPPWRLAEPLPGRSY